MRSIVLIRHGQTDWNVEGRWQGHADPPLNEFGRQQARLLVPEMREAGLTALYSSDLRRALETAEIIAAELHLVVIPEPRLREIDLGQWQGMLADEIEERYLEAYLRWHESPLTVRPPGGEDIQTLANRVLECANEILGRHPEQRVGLVSHELPIAVIMCRSLGLDLNHFREFIPRTGTWHEVLLEGMLT
jgi:broad specificity phosphatase PhoE